MEPVRRDVDAFVLDWLRSRTFRESEFFETREGICRLMPSVARELAETGPRWAREVAPAVEGVARRLVAHGKLGGQGKEDIKPQE